jgi:hypothetical protein
MTRFRNIDEALAYARTAPTVYVRNTVANVATNSGQRLADVNFSVSENGTTHDVKVYGTHLPQDLGTRASAEALARSPQFRSLLSRKILEVVHHEDAYLELEDPSTAAEVARLGNRIARIPMRTPEEIAAAADAPSEDEDAVQIVSTATPGFNNKVVDSDGQPTTQAPVRGVAKASGPLKAATVASSRRPVNASLGEQLSALFDSLQANEIAEVRAITMLMAVADDVTPRQLQSLLGFIGAFPTLTKAVKGLLNPESNTIAVSPGAGKAIPAKTSAAAKPSLNARPNPFAKRPT